LLNRGFLFGFHARNRFAMLLGDEFIFLVHCRKDWLKFCLKFFE
jgi:hypothetical protein